MQASIDFDGTLTGSIAGGGGGGGSDVSITPTYNQGTKIADYSIDGNEGAIYTPEIEISKYVSSGVKICEIEGVEIFAPSYGYIDTLGDSNVEQIGGFSQGANVTPVNVKRVSYTNDVSNGEKIGSLTVGDTSYNVYQKPNTSVNYSTTEQNTGRKWIDGRDIYQITIPYTMASTDNLIDLTDYNVDLILNMEGYIMHNNGEILLHFPYYDSANYFVVANYYRNPEELHIITTSQMISSYNNLNITIQYIKVV